MFCDSPTLEADSCVVDRAGTANRREYVDVRRGGAAVAAAAAAWRGWKAAWSSGDASRAAGRFVVKDG